MENVNFFQKIAPLAQGMDLTFVIRAKGEDLTLCVLPKSSTGSANFELMPLLMKGSAQKMDESLFDEMLNSLKKIPDVISSIEMFEAYALKQKKASEDKARGKKDDKKEASKTQIGLFDRSSPSPASKEEELEEEEEENDQE